MGRYAPSTKILSLDLATEIGWAFGAADSVPIWGHYRLPKTGDNIGPYIGAFHMWLVQMLKEHKPDMMVFEAPINGMGQTTMSTQLKLKGLIVHAEFVAHMKNMEQPVQVSNSTWKKHVCGNGRFGKDVKPYPPSAAMERLGFVIPNNNAADAMCIWHYIVNTINPARAAASTPLFARAV